MAILSDLKRKELQNLCQEFQVKELYLFGSVVTGNFSEESDLDFIVNFDRKNHVGAFDQFIGFKQRLEKIYERKVDLYHHRKYRNPIFQKEVESTKELVYAT